MDDYASRQRQPTKHLLGLGLVLVLHLLLFWAINTGLAQSFAYVPPADVPLVNAAPAANAIAAVSATPQPPAPPAPSAPAVTSAPVRTSAVVNSANCEKPDYPSASRRMEEEGTVSLRFLVGVDGKVVQSEIEKSSGFKRLDEAA
eukprot:gene5012-4902_t